MTTTPGDIGEKLHIVSIRVMHVNAVGLHDSHTPPLSVVCDKPPAIMYSRYAKTVAFTVGYWFGAQDASGKEVWRIECKLLLTYSLLAETTNEELQQCGERVARDAHNYLRAFVGTICTHMGLPRLTLELFRPPA